MNLTIETVSLVIIDCSIIIVLAIVLWKKIKRSDISGNFQRYGKLQDDIWKLEERLDNLEEKKKED